MKTSKLLITTLLAAAAMGADAFADTTPLLPELSSTAITQISGSRPDGWSMDIGKSSISASVVDTDLRLSSALQSAGWHWGASNWGRPGSDVTVSGSGFAYVGRGRFDGEYVAATIDVSSLLGEGVASGKVELNIGFSADGENTASFSIWSWNSTDGATEIYKTIGFSSPAQTIDFSKNVVLSSSDKLFVVWNDNSGGSSNTITNLTSSYAVSANYATLYWRGGDATWSSTSTTWNATSSETIGNVAATSVDDVIFDSSATVAVDSGGVAVDTLAISSGTVSFSGGAVAVKSGLALSDGTTLSLNGTSVNTGYGTTIGANAQLTVSGDGALNTTITSVGSNAQLVLGGTGANAVTLNGTIGAGATVNVSSGTLSGTITSMGLGSSLTLAGTDANNKSTVSISGGTTLSGSLTIGNATVNVSAQNDTFNWGNNTSDQLIVLNEGGTLNFGEKRQSLNSRVKFTLKGGTIIGAGDADGAMDFYKENTVKVTADSSIEASIRLRSDGGSGDLTFDVDDGATLTVSGVINKKKDNNNTRKIVKTGYGKMILSGNNSNYSNGGFSIQKGTLVAQSATALGSGAIAIANVGTLELAAATGTFSNVISGAGAIKKTGMGTVTLAGENIYTGSTTIERGVLVAAHASALGASTATTTVNSGGVLKVAVDGGVTAGMVTLNGGALFAIDLTTMTVAEDTALTIISSSAISFNSISASAMSSNDIEAYFSASNSNLGEWTDYLRTWSYDAGSGLQLTLTIPEPSMFGLLAGLGALALAGTRRRRRK